MWQYYILFGSISEDYARKHCTQLIKPWIENSYGEKKILRRNIRLQRVETIKSWHTSEKRVIEKREEKFASIEFWRKKKALHGFTVIMDPLFAILIFRTGHKHMRNCVLSRSERIRRKNFGLLHSMFFYKY